LLLVRSMCYRAPLRLKIGPDKYREPDFLLRRSADDPRNQHAFWLGADLVVEIVGPDDPERDTRIKRADHTEADVPEYRMVNPEDQTITVLSLDGEEYQEAGVYHRAASADAALLAGFSAPVDAVREAQ
jgi:Uma2 family endonuclease